MAPEMALPLFVPLQTPFLARPLPAATLEPRYVELNAEQEIVRESNRHTSHQWHKVGEPAAGSLSFPRLCRIACVGSRFRVY